MTAPIEQELLPCPRCASEVKSRTDILSSTRFQKQVVCLNQLCPLEFTLQGNGCDSESGLEALLFELWNTRATPKPSGEVNLSLTDEALHSKLMMLEHLARTADAWLASEDAYHAANGEDVPFSVEYASIVESRIFNNHALREAIRNFRSQTKGVGE